MGVIGLTLLSAIVAIALGVALFSIVDRAMQEPEHDARADEERQRGGTDMRS